MPDDNLANEFKPGINIPKASDCILTADTDIWDDVPMNLHDLLDSEMFSDSDPGFLGAISHGRFSLYEHSTLVNLVDTAMTRLEAVKVAISASPLNSPLAQSKD